VIHEGVIALLHSTDREEPLQQPTSSQSIQLAVCLALSLCLYSYRRSHSHIQLLIASICNNSQSCIKSSTLPACRSRSPCLVSAFERVRWVLLLRWGLPHRPASCAGAVPLATASSRPCPALACSGARRALLRHLTQSRHKFLMTGRCAMHAACTCSYKPRTHLTSSPSRPMLFSSSCTRSRSLHMTANSV
jgi:hypothetical protein